MTPTVPFKVNFYYVVSFAMVLVMSFWMIFNFEVVSLGDVILFWLLDKITRYARHIRRQFGA